MSQAKLEAIELINRLPETVSTADILDELYFKEQVERGLRDVVEGRVITQDELKERLRTLSCLELGLNGLND